MDKLEIKLWTLEAKGHIVPDRSLLKTPQQIEAIKKSAALNTAVLDHVAAHIRAGMSTAEIDKLVYDFTKEHGGIPAPLGYEGFPKTAIQWPVTPECLQWGPKFLYERYHKPIYITENGLSCHDVISLDGKVHDPQRTDFIYRYLGGVKRAISEGIPVIGYQYWSLMDNFEWAEGYSPRFGLIYIDFETQERILKDSAYEYKKIIETNGDCL